MTGVTDILPPCTQLNTIIAKALNGQSIKFAQQQFVEDFHTQFNNIKSFEAMQTGLKSRKTMYLQGIYLNLATMFTTNSYMGLIFPTL